MHDFLSLTNKCGRTLILKHSFSFIVIRSFRQDKGLDFAIPATQKAPPMQGSAIMFRKESRFPEFCGNHNLTFYAHTLYGKEPLTVTDG